MKPSSKSTKVWDSKHVDKVTVKLPKGLKEEILSTGNTINGFSIQAIKEKLEKIKGSNE